LSLLAPAAVERAASTPPPLVAALVERGVSRAKAAQIVADYRADFIREKLEVFDWLTDQRDKRVAKSPAGYLVKSITDDYAAPNQFRSKAQRQREDEKRRTAERKAADARRREKEQDADNASRLRAVDAYLERLDPDKRASLEAEALAEAADETRRAYESCPTAKYRHALMLGVLREYVGRMLRRPERAAVKV
jgi:hypothetical protein